MFGEFGNTLDRVAQLVSTNKIIILLLLQIITYWRKKKFGRLFRTLLKLRT